MYNRLIQCDCRLNGSYEALQGGSAAEAMEDFTGGVTETVDIQQKDVSGDLFTVMRKAFDRKSLMSCCVDVSTAGSLSISRGVHTSVVTSNSAFCRKHRVRPARATSFVKLCTCIRS